MEEYPDEIAYDWRTRFGVPSTVIGGEMDWVESVRLARVLLADQTSWLGAKVAGHSRPWSPEAWILANLYDLTAAANSKHRPKPHPRPSDLPPKRVGNPALPQHVIRAALRARGHR